VKNPGGLRFQRLAVVKGEHHFRPKFMKGTAMKSRTAFGSIIMMCVLALPAFAGGKGELQGYFNDAVTKAKATSNPAEKRQILNESFRTISTALDIVKGLPLVSSNDVAGIERLKATLQEKQDELAGSNGYAQVPDEQLNAFSDYVVQDMEQADQVVTISLVTLLLIVILIVLIAK
jgi:hypothetical protein